MDYYWYVPFVVIIIIVFTAGFVWTIIGIAFLVKKHSENNTNGSNDDYQEKLKKEAKHFGKTSEFGFSFLPCDQEINKQTLRQSKKAIDLLWKILTEIANFHHDQKEYIVSSISRYKRVEMNSIANHMSIEKINLNGSRVNVNALKAARVRTIGDLARFSSRYETIYGIGKVSAENITRNYRAIMENIKNSVKIRISYDKKTEVSGELLRSILIYNESEPYSAKAKELLKLKDYFNHLLNEAKTIARSYSMWRKQEEAIQNIQTIQNKLIELFNANFSNIDEELIIPFNEVKSLTAADAWLSFKKDPIPFNKIIEMFSGQGIVTQGLSDYQLTNDVVALVKETPLDLTGFKLGLRQYQEWGTKYIICQKRTIIGDEMGLGKTVEAIAAMVSLSNGGAKHFMVVCPLSVLTNWCREVYRFSSLNYYRIYQYEKDINFKRWKETGGVAITTYETLNSLSLFGNYNIDLLVVDEAHLIKNASAIRTQNTRFLIDRSERATFLTGTVLENKVDEMIKLISYLNPTVANQAERTKSLSDFEPFKENISKVYFRRRRYDVLSELPEKTEIEDWCDINEEELNEYRDAVIKGRFMEARRVSWNVDSGSSTKMAKLKNIVELAKQDDRKILVFSFFLDTIRKIKEELCDISYGPIYGAVSTTERQQIIDNFNDAPAGSVLVCQIQSGGIGLNIQSASVVVICEPQFKPSTENQAISRSYRMGQARNVLVYHLLATNTVDERLNEILSAKQTLFDNYADSSLIADKSFQIDKDMFTGIMKKEFERFTGRQIQKSDIKLDYKENPIAPRQVVIMPTNFVPAPPGGVSVTRRISMIKQPLRGYLPISDFEVSHLHDGKILGEENVHASLIGLAVDYLSRFVHGTPREEAFHISLFGARNVHESEHANQLLKLINSLNDISITSAIKLAGYDVAYRNSPIYYKPVEEIWPDKQTINNVRIMVERSQAFFDKFGPVVKDGFTFEGGYTKTISSGDGDFLTSNTLWDFKVLKKEPTSVATLQVLIYYLMGLHSIHPEFKDIKYLGFFNPRHNTVYKYDLEKLLPEVKEQVERMVIGYK